MRTSVGAGCLISIALMILNATLGAWLWPYSLNAWLVFLGKAPLVLWWHGVVLGFIPYFGNLTIPFAAITWILMLVVS